MTDRDFETQGEMWPKVYSEHFGWCHEFIFPECKPMDDFCKRAADEWMALYWNEVAKGGKGLLEMLDELKTNT